MITVSHNCYMTRQKKTTMGCDSSAFHGAGVPLNVILPAFFDKKIVWYSLQYGDFQDNILLVGVDPEKAHSLENITYAETSPMENASGVSSKFEEYQLSNGVMAALNISNNEITKEFSIPDTETVLLHIYIHDDHFSYVKPVDHILLKQIVSSILQQHSYYLNIEVDWSDVIDGMTDMISKNNAVLIQSQPSRSCLVIRYEGLLPWLISIIAPKSCRAILVNNGKAKFTSSFLKNANNK